MTGQKDAYNEIYLRSIRDPVGFWGPIAEQFHWYRKWDKVLDDSKPPFFKWFTGGLTNLCYNAVDRHVKNGLGGKTAFIWEGAAQGITRIITYDELLREVNRFAGVLKSLGVEKGDRVLTFLPTVPETVYAMLACVRIGALHAAVFTGYGTGAITQRILSAQPNVALTADGSFRRSRIVPLKDMLDIAMQNAPVDRVVVLNRGITPVNMVPGRDLDWAELVRQHAGDTIEPLPVESEHPSHLVFTSGDTGNPRGVVNDTGGYIVGLGNSMPMLYGVHPDDVFWATSDIGWRLGHNHAVYGPLLYGVTSLLFEGTPDFPDHAVYWRFIEKHRVNIMFSVPTIFKMLKRFGIEHRKKHDISSLRLLFVGAEFCDPDTWKWATAALDGIPVIDHYWLTEAGWPMTSIMAGVGLLPIKPGYASKACIGWDLEVVDKQGNPVPANTKGILVAKPPLPPANIMTLWHNDKFYEQEYWNQFPGKRLFVCGDYATRDEDGYIAIGSRIDEVINVAGHRVSTREIAEAIGSHPAVTEVCVIGVYDALKGEEPVGLVVLKAGIEGTTQVKNELRNAVREKVGAIAAPKDIHFVPSLPKNRKGKHMRAVYKAVHEGVEINDPAALEEDASVEEIRVAADIIKQTLNTKL
ncbi:MAG: AMP-binding protein [Dehalococcoidia bacterium]|nr:AMP-binding protein [Dehalococcoidia bacterium]